MKKISVIIPSYNSFLTIRHTLDALLRQPEDLLEEIIVVDSSDDSKTAELLAGYRSDKLNLVRLPEKTIPALGRNIGAERAKGEILAFIDADAYPDRYWLQKISEAYERGCRVGGGSIALPDFQKKTRIAVAQYFLQFNEFMDAGRERQKKFVPACNLFCDKALFKELGGFQDIRAAEDVLFGLKASGHSPLYFIPEAKVYHIFREALGAYLKNQELLGRYILVYRRYHLKSQIYDGWVPALLLPFFLIIKFFRIIARLLKTGRPEILGSFFLSLPLFILGLGSWGMGFWKACWDKTESALKNE